MKFMVLFIASALYCSCSPCLIRGDMSGAEIKAVLLRCKGEPLRRTFEKPGGPFTSETEIWDYSPSETLSTDSFWFSGGLLDSMPSHSPGVRIAP
jgi:hypothetical protein